MSNPYPVEIADPGDGVVKTAGNLTFTDPANQPGGGSQPVSCVLAREANLDIHASGNHPILWDALYDDLVNFNTLSAIPAGLGLTFVFDGSASTLTATEAGIWSFTHNIDLDADDTWTGHLSTGTTTVTLLNPHDGAAQFYLPTQVVALPAGAAQAQVISTGVGATSDPYNLRSDYLSIVRIG